ncbi:hypothetical protein [Enterococcus lactis]|uniref:hypothetical protein n=1 Tax=Enterococcus lactis TaxID=357441 RepID=UPI0022E0A971|nr:hypothetical protein [Enterococcus lactis]
MKKLTHLFFVVLTLLPFAATPVQTHAQETYTIKAEQHATTEVVPELPSISRIPVTTQEPDPHNAALVPLTGGVSFSSFLSPFSAVGATLSSALVSLPASAAVVSAILGAGLGYSFYQLGFPIILPCNKNWPLLPLRELIPLLVPIISRKVCKKDTRKT